jgi:WD40 repeat protein
MSGLRFQFVLVIFAALALDRVRAGEPKAVPIPIAALNRTKSVDFEAEILPIFRASCLACHNRTTTKAGLILETPQTILKGSEDGPVVVPGKSEESSLLQSAAHRSKPIMPPRDNKASAPNLTSEQLALVKLWIDQGAKGEVHSQAIAWQRIPRGFTPAYAAAVSADGQFAAVGRANQLHLYHLPTLAALAPLTDPGRSGISAAAHRDVIYSLAFGPDGGTLASGSFGEVKLWRRALPAVKFSLAGGAVALSPNGKWVACAGSGGRIDLVDASTGRVVKALPNDLAVKIVRFSLDGARLACAGEKRVRVWNIADGTLSAGLATAAEIRSVAWTNDGRRLAVGQVDGGLHLYALDDANGDDADLGGHSGAVSALDALLPGNQLASGGSDGTVRIWNLGNSQAVRHVSHGAPVTAVSARSDGKVVASAGEDGVVKIWDVAKGAVLFELKGDPELLKQSADAEVAQKLAAGNVAFAKSVLQKAQADQKAQQERLKKALDAKAAAEKAAGEKEAAVAKSADDKARGEAEKALKPAVLARNNATNEADLAAAAVQRLGDQVTAAQVGADAADQKQKSSDAQAAGAKAAAAVQKPVRAIAFSPDGATLATAGDDGKIHLWNANGGGLLQTVQTHGSPVLAIVLGANQSVLSASADGAVTMWDISCRWTLARTIGTGDADSPLTDRVNAVCFSPDGQTLATGSGEPSRGGQVMLWDAASGKLVREFKNVHSDAVLALAFSRDGTRLSSGAADRFVKVLDLTGQRPRRLVLEGHTYHVLGVSFKADGRTLASCGADGQVKFWDLMLGERKGANIPPVGKELSSIQFIGISDQAIVSQSDDQIRLINDAGAAVRAFSGPADHIHAAALTPDGKTYVTAGQSGALYLWDVSTGKLLATLNR